MPELTEAKTPDQTIPDQTIPVTMPVTIQQVSQAKSATIHDPNILDDTEKRIVVVEMGAGSAIPTIRATSERIGWSLEHADVIRINPREPEIKMPHISIPCGALEGLLAINAELLIPRYESVPE